VYEGHPAVPLWTWDEDTPGIRDDRSYFARSHVNDTFPARGATAGRPVRIMSSSRRIRAGV
jgi:hypothetical protein